MPYNVGSDQPSTPEMLSNMQAGQQGAGGMVVRFHCRWSVEDHYNDIVEDTRGCTDRIQLSTQWIRPVVSASSLKGQAS